MTTKKIRIAVAISESGEWSACGWRATKESELMDSAVEGMMDSSMVAEIWVEVEVPLPQQIVIAGTVQPELSKTEE